MNIKTALLSVLFVASPVVADVSCILDLRVVESDVVYHSGPMECILHHNDPTFVEAPNSVFECAVRVLEERGEDVHMKISVTKEGIVVADPVMVVALNDSATIRVQNDQGQELSLNVQIMPLVQ